MPALLVIDIQNGLTHDKKLFNESLFFQTVNNTIKKFRTQGYTIIFFQHNNKQLVQDSNAWQIDSRIDKDHGDIIIQKFHADAFEGTALQDVLGRKGIREIMVCGLVTHG